MCFFSFIFYFVCLLTPRARSRWIGVVFLVSVNIRFMMLLSIFYFFVQPTEKQHTHNTRLLDTVNDYFVNDAIELFTFGINPLL